MWISNFWNDNNFSDIDINNSIIGNITWNSNLRNNNNHHFIISFLYNSKLIIVFFNKINDTLALLTNFRYWSYLENDNFQSWCFYTYIINIENINI